MHDRDRVLAAVYFTVTCPMRWRWEGDRQIRVRCNEREFSPEGWHSTPPMLLHLLPFTHRQILRRHRAVGVPTRARVGLRERAAKAEHVAGGRVGGHVHAHTEDAGLLGPDGHVLPGDNAVTDDPGPAGLDAGLWQGEGGGGGDGDQGGQRNLHLESRERAAGVRATEFDAVREPLALAHERPGGGAEGVGQRPRRGTRRHDDTDGHEAVAGKVGAAVEGGEGNE